MGHRRVKLVLVATATTMFAAGAKVALLRPAIASEDICHVQLFANDEVIQEISEPIKPAPPSTDDRRAIRRYERELRQYERKLERFVSRIEKFKERVERSQQNRRGRLSMMFGENCENYEREPALPIDELVINGNVPEGQEAPRIEGNRVIFADGTQLEFTESGGRLFDANGGEIQHDQPVRTTEGLPAPSISPEILEVIEPQLREQVEGDEF